jgi:transcriptional regulator with XRE-family HTH domain
MDVRPLRKELGLTQVQLADLLGVQQSEVSNWERGARWVPPHTFEKLEGLVLRRNARAILERALPPGTHTVPLDVAMEMVLTKPKALALATKLFVSSLDDHVARDRDRGDNAEDEGIALAAAGADDEAVA